VDAVALSCGCGRLLVELPRRAIAGRSDALPLLRPPSPPFYLTTLFTKDFYISSTIITERQRKNKNKGVTKQGGGGAVATRRSTPERKERAENDLRLKVKKQF
jgi:hypothetical protein